MSNYTDLVVADEECEELTEVLIQMCTTMENSIQEFCDNLDYVVENAISEGEASKSIANYSTAAKNLLGCYKDLKETIKASLPAFSKEIDRVDKYIY